METCVIKSFYGMLLSFTSMSGNECWENQKYKFVIPIVSFLLFWIPKIISKFLKFLEICSIIMKWWFCYNYFFFNDNKYVLSLNPLILFRSSYWFWRINIQFFIKMSKFLAIEQITNKILLLSYSFCLFVCLEKCIYMPSDWRVQ